MDITETFCLTVNNRKCYKMKSEHKLEHGVNFEKLNAKALCLVELTRLSVGGAHNPPILL